MEGRPPLESMLQVVASAAKTSEPRTVVPVVGAGTPVDVALAARAATIARQQARLATQITHQIAGIEATTFHGVPVESPKDVTTSLMEES
ncbi:hypothetical protein [Mycobacterium intracellulare]|uniref:hypothetical protein n=1 Tax=Mycobacterium intracellulare TaxID=1767 RepID=UPI0006CAA6EE|nr:hypothetical protein [Mycobacterium intracellulare]KPN47699.1 hypothetical protein AN933_24090 [Mycobacterium intracellulare subsp. chimaera]